MYQNLCVLLSAFYLCVFLSAIIQQPPYISSSGMLVGTKFTATYVGMVVE